MKTSHVSDKPLLGYYGSMKGETIQYHLDLFEKMNLDFIILNLHVDHAGVNSIELLAIQNLFEIIRTRKTNLKFVIQLCPYVIDSVDNVVTAVAMISKIFKDHPNYFHHNEKPLLYWFWTGFLDGQKTFIEKISAAAIDYHNIAVSLRLPNAVEEHKLTFNFFEGFIPFSPLELSSRKNWYSIWEKWHEATKLLNTSYRGMSISPGYDDTGLDDNERIGNPYRSIPRENGKTYQYCFEFAHKINRPDFFIISTFNEFHENSHIEPTLRYGDLYYRLTKKWIDELKVRFSKKINHEVCEII